MHQALYRKYRPVDFDSVIGQDSIIKILENSIINNKINHAYMFFGPRGTGKTTVSKIFARSINCLNPKDGCSCGKCDNCLHSYEKECIDIIELDAASNNGVDEIREIINNVNLVPNYLKYKVYIIDEVHMLSAGAFNALLKTLEEPPEHIVFILATTDPQKVPDTIVSRCQCYSFKRIPTDLIVENLKNIAKKEKIKIDDDVLEQIAIASNGGMRDSLVTLDQLSSFTSDKIDIDVYSELNGTITYNDIDIFINDLFTGNVNSIINTINDFNNKSKNIILIVNQIINYLRNKVVDNYTKKDCYLSNANLYIDFINYLNENLNNLKSSDDVKIYFESLILKFMFDNKLIEESNIDNEKIVVENNISEKPEKPIINNTIDEKKEEEIVVTSNNDDKKKEKNVKKDVNEDKNKVVDKKVLNIDDIIKVRINNTFANASKPEKNNFIELKKKFNDFINDDEIGHIASLINDSNVLVVSSDSVLLGIKYDSIIDQLNEYFNILSDVFKKVLDKEYIVSYILDDEWQKYEKEYIDNIKKKYTYSLIEEPKPIFEEVENNDIISSSAVDLFGEDIVEIN